MLGLRKMLYRPLKMNDWGAVASEWGEAICDENQKLLTTIRELSEKNERLMKEWEIMKQENSEMRKIINRINIDKYIER